jgi:alpha-1,2-mannosyltransferase
MAVICGVCFAGALVALRVSDPVWWVAAASAPVTYTLYAANETAIVVLAVALAWRWRDQAWRAGLALAVAVAVKLFAAPLVAWLVWTRRWRAAAVAVGGSVALVFGAWALIGFDGIARYPDLLRADAIAVGDRGLSLQALLRQQGAGYGVAVLAGVALCALLLLVGRRLDDGRCFAVASFACLVVSPIVWTYYLWLVLVGMLATGRSTVKLAYVAAWCVLSYLMARVPEGTFVTSVMLVTVAGMVVLALMKPVAAAPAPVTA